MGLEAAGVPLWEPLALSNREGTIKQQHRGPWGTVRADTGIWALELCGGTGTLSTMPMITSLGQDNLLGL